MASQARFRFRPRVFRLAEPLSAPSASAYLARLAHVADGRAMVLVDGTARDGSFVLGFDPLPMRGLDSILEVRGALAQLVRDRGDEIPGPFQGGFLGAFSYDIGSSEDPRLVLPRDPWRLPRVLGGLYVDFIVRVPAGGATYLVLGEDPLDDRAGLRERRERIESALASSIDASSVRALGPLERGTGRAEHCRRIESARALIAAGEFYQANLSFRCTRLLEADPGILYGRLACLQPAPHAGFLRSGASALLSASPELLLDLRREGTGFLARTRPIKGTGPRGRTRAEDQANVARLFASAKDRAELAMIVDLERNDLGRIAEPKSVRVRDFPSLISLANVHHLCADVEAHLCASIDGPAALAALFPGGSVTGAPKLRSMEAIAELEGEGRGFSYGALGWFGLDGSAYFALLIRTLVWRARPELGARAGEACYRVGGGITWSSDALAEDEEALAKGRVLARALSGDEEDPTLEPDLHAPAESSGRVEGATGSSSSISEASR